MPMNYQLGNMEKYFLIVLVVFLCRILPDLVDERPVKMNKSDQ